MLRRMMISAVLAAGLLAADVPVQGAPRPLSNDDVLTLAKAGLGENTLIAAIQAQDSNFDISAPALLELKQDGVTTQVLGAMVTAMRKQHTAGSVSQPGIANMNSQPPASTTADLPNSAPSTSQAPVAPTSAKGSWLRAFTAHGAVGQGLSSAGSNIANGTSHAGSSFKNNFLAGFSNAANRQSNAYASGVSNQSAPTGSSTSLASTPADQANLYYLSADGSVMPAENSAQAAQGSRQPAGAGTPTPAPGKPRQRRPKAPRP